MATSPSTSRISNTQCQASRPGANDLSQWQLFVAKFFSDEGMFRIQAWSSQDESTKQFDVPAPSIPGFYHTHLKSGVDSIQLALEAGSEKDMSNGSHLVIMDRARFTYWFHNGTQVCHLQKPWKLDSKKADEGIVDILWSISGHL